MCKDMKMTRFQMSLKRGLEIITTKQQENGTQVKVLLRTPSGQRFNVIVDKEEM